MNGGVVKTQKINLKFQHPHSILSISLKNEKKFYLLFKDKNTEMKLKKNIFSNPLPSFNILFI